MCAFCGALGIAEHWTDEPGEAPAPAAAARHYRVAVANRLLAGFGLTLSSWADRYTLTSRTGGMAVVDSFGGLWPAAEKLAGRPLDPLDPALIAALEGRR